MVENRTKNKVLDNSYINDKLELVINKIEKDRQNIEKLFNLTGRNKELIDEIKMFIKNIKTLSINMQRDRPSEWNEFFQLAMDI